MIVVIEGIDGSGKGTQAKLLHQKLLSVGRSANLLSFPRYTETFFGRETGKYLNGEYEPNQDPRLVSLLYALDRFQSKPIIEAYQKSTGLGSPIVVCDRYTTSSMAHQAAKHTEPIKRIAMAQYIDCVEYDILGISRPHMVILLDLPVETAMAHIQEKNKRDYTDKKADIHEADRSHLEMASLTYRELASRYGWTTISCGYPTTDNKDLVLLSVEEIADRIFTAVRESIHW